MDPDTLKDFNKRQARIGNLQSSMQSGDIVSGYVRVRVFEFGALTVAFRLSALMSTGEEEKPVPKPATPSGLKHRGGKNKKR